MAVVGHAKGMFKAGGAAVLGLLTGGAAMYGRAAFEKVSKVQPLANFSVADTDGLKVTFQNLAVGDTGYWDFGDGSPLEPFAVDAPVTHTYAKPGSYTARLTVRNFLMEEKDRSVTVAVADGPAAPALLPKVTLTVEPISRHSLAPATFRVKGTADNVERVFLDLGDKVEVQAEGGVIDKLIVVDKPGSFPIQLIGHSGKQAVKESVRVEVQGDKAGTLSAVVRVTDVGSRPVRDLVPQMIPVAAVKGAKGFEKVVAAPPGAQAIEAKLGAAPKGVKGLTATVAADKRTVKLTGEWDGASEAVVPLTLAVERLVPVSLPQTMAASLDANGAATINLPPQLRGGSMRRQIAIELRATDGAGRPMVVASQPNLSGKWEQPTADKRVIRAEVVGEQVRVTVGR